MLTAFKSLARNVCPEMYQNLRRMVNPHHRLTRLVIHRQGLKIAAGPFTGMRYIPQSRGSRLIPKLIGSYEAELHPALARVIQWRPDLVVDIGCAEGYYSVGLACVLPQARVVAFDSDEPSRQYCRQLSEWNMVHDRIDIREKCDTAALNELSLENAFVLSDCEGSEKVLLDPVKVPQLIRSVILAELHDVFVPDTTPLLISRFTATHKVEMIDVQPRDPMCYPLLRQLPPDMQQLALYERDTDIDPPQQWLFLIPKGLSL